MAVSWCVAAARADDTQPWVKGVTAERKAAAKQLLDAGNALFLEHRYAEALDKYREAVAAWDHPAIRFNIVRSLIQLDRPVEASDNLELALQYGAAPLEDAVYNEALAYRKLLAGQIGHMSIRCALPDVKVTLDGQPVACPSEDRRVTPGAHQVVGAKDGFLTRTTELVVVGGTHADVEVSLVRLEAGGKIVHRYATWKPWVVFGGGVAVGVVGGLLETFAASRMSEYNSALVRDCAHSCTAIPAADVELERSAQHYDTAAWIVIGAGGAATAAGIALLYANRGRTVYPEAHAVPGGAVVSIGGGW
jgi:hypothetical protein